MARKSRLGRGLDAMLPPPVERPERKPSTSSEQSKMSDKKSASQDISPDNEGVYELAINRIVPMPGQPRYHFAPEALAELSESIRQMGVLEPIVVRKQSGEGAKAKYEIIAGERRFRASKAAGLKQVPVHIRKLDDQEAFEAALVENVQRADLSSVETARAYQRLIDEFDYTQAMIAKRIAKSRSSVANLVRLLALPEPVLVMIEKGELSEGHGRALLGLNDASAIKKAATQIIREGLSVRDAERLVREGVLNSPERPSRTKSKVDDSANIRAFETRLGKYLGAVIKVKDKSGKGSLRIDYSSYEHLEQILKTIKYK